MIEYAVNTWIKLLLARVIGVYLTPALPQPAPALEFGIEPRWIILIQGRVAESPKELVSQPSA